MVNLGIGLPTMVPSFLPPDVRVVLEADKPETIAIELPGEEVFEIAVDGKAEILR